MPKPGGQAVADGGFSQIVSIAGVAAEAFVAAVARKDDLDAAAGQPGHQVRRYGGGIGKGLVVETGQFAEQVDRLRRDDLLDVLGAELIRCLPRLRQLAECLIGKADGESLKRPVRFAGRRRHDDTRIDAAAQECADWNVGNQVKSDGLIHLGPDLFLPFGRCRPRVGLEPQPPVALRIGVPAPFVDDQDTGRRKFLHAAKNGTLAGYDAEGEVVLEGLFVDLPGNIRAGENGLELGAEEQFVAVTQKVKRFDAEPVACKQ